jgi:hypothetical protein
MTWYERVYGDGKVKAKTGRESRQTCCGLFFWWVWFELGLNLLGDEMRE